MSFLRVQILQVQLDEEEAATLEDVEVAVDEASRTGTQETDLGDGFIFFMFIPIWGNDPIWLGCSHQSVMFLSVFLCSFAVFV